MATVPPAPRTNIITLASDSAGPFLVGFRLFEAAALRVYVNGELSTDYTVSATFLNGYDDDATITFNSTLLATTEIQIDGFMTPARNADYLNGPGLVDALNVELARVWAVLSENRMLLKRAVLGLSDVGAGDAADAGGRRIKNLAAPQDGSDALRLIDQQNVVSGGGNVPSPTAGQIGHLLRASAAGVFGWSTLASIIGAALEAIRPISPAADRAVYFNGTSTAALMTVTSFARTLLDDTSAAAMRTTLGVPQSGNIVVSDFAPGAVITASAGLRGNAVETAVPTAAAVRAAAQFTWVGIPNLTVLAPQDMAVPAGVSEIVALFTAPISLTGTDDFMVRLGDSGGIKTTGYFGRAALSATTTLTLTDGFRVPLALATREWAGEMRFHRVDPVGHTWRWSFYGAVNGGLVASGSGEVDLTSELTTVRFGASGANGFDSGGGAQFGYR